MHTSEWRRATEICEQYGKYECCCAARELMETFSENARVICIRTPGRHQVIVRGQERVSDTGRHVAVVLHDKVFDNLYPMGVEIAEWVSSFIYCDDRQNHVRFQKNQIEDLSEETFIEYCGSAEDDKDPCRKE